MITLPGLKAGDGPREAQKMVHWKPGRPPTPLGPGLCPQGWWVRGKLVRSQKHLN